MNDLDAAAPISPLRQRLIDDMTMRRFSRETQRNYIRDVGRLATLSWDARPDTATAEDLRRFQVEQREAGVPVPTMNTIVSALRFFFTQTARPSRSFARRLVRVTHPRKLPVVLSPDEVARLLERDNLPEASGGSGGRLWCRPARRRGREPQSRRHRQRAHAAQDRARQRRAISQRHALRRYARPAASLVEGRSSARRDAFQGLAVSRPACGQADQHQAVASDRRRGGADGGHRQAGRTAHAAPQLRDAPARGWRRHPRDPGVARPCQLDNTAFYTRVATRTVRTVTSPLDKIAVLIGETTGSG